VSYIDKRHKQNLFKASAIYQRLLHPIYYRWWPYKKEDAQFERSKAAVLKLASAVGSQNIMFIQLPEKPELSSELANFGERGKRFIIDNGFTYLDGFQKCGLTIADFHVHDGHPNGAGYRKIGDCVEGSVKAVFGIP
jgi:hypothetical protein